MASPGRYFVEMRNSCGTTIGVHVTAFSTHDAMTRASEDNPGYRALFARRIT